MFLEPLSHVHCLHSKCRHLGGYPQSPRGQAGKALLRGYLHWASSNETSVKKVFGEGKGGRGGIGMQAREMPTHQSVHRHGVLGKFKWFHGTENSGYWGQGEI